MRRTLLAALPLALLVLAPPAAAKDGRKHTTYRATLAAVAAEEPTASPSRREHDYGAAEVRGKAVLVDGRKRDRVKLRVRGLDRGVEYTWQVRQGGCAGEAVGGFRYRALKVRRGGAKGRGVSRSFTADAGASYALVVSGPHGAVACGEFERKGAKRKRGGDHVEPPACDDVSGDDEGLDDSGHDFGDDELGGDDEPVAKRATDDSCDEDESAGDVDDSSDDESDDGDAADDHGGDDSEDDDF